MLGDAVAAGTLVKLTLGGYRGGDPTLERVLVRPVTLGAGPRLSFTYRHETRDITQNFTHEEGLARVAALLASDFASAHLSTTQAVAELAPRRGKAPRLVLGPPARTAPPPTAHDRPKSRLIDPAAPWLHALGVTTADGRVVGSMAAKLKQANKFVEILDGLVAELPARAPGPLRLVDMGCGKGYLTFAAYEHLRRLGFAAEVRGVEARAELVDLCNQAAAAHGLGGLRFEHGAIDGAALAGADVVVALHACDTATDDAIARGVAAGAALIIVAPCCHKELRPQLRPPPVMAGALRHGILRTREAELITDAVRAGLLEWAGYAAKVFEFIESEHTAKNLMIAAVRRAAAAPREAAAAQVRALCTFYGVTRQRLAQHLGLDLA
jgi:SAM-dependent methyltransferase